MGLGGFIHVQGFGFVELPGKLLGTPEPVPRTLPGVGQGNAKFESGTLRPAGW